MNILTEVDINRLAQYFYEEGGTRRIAMTEKPELVASLTRALKRLVPELQGGTELPDDGRRVANAGEFAAACNNRTAQQREDLVVQLLHHQDTTIKCFQQDHNGLLEQLRTLQAKRNEWIVLYWHEDCVECEGHAESAITYAQVTGSVGMTHKKTEVIPYDRAGDPTFTPAIAHGAKVRRAG